jgi:hypothetical protein
VSITANSPRRRYSEALHHSSDAAETHEKELLKTVHQEHDPDHDP